MAEQMIECPKCGAQLAYEDDQVGMTLECPSCEARFQLFWPEDEEAAAEPPAAAESAPKLPERMKANKLVDGRICPTCGQAVFFGQDVHNCQKCGQTVHESCWEDGGCPSCRAGSSLADPDGPPIALKRNPLGSSLPPPIPPALGGSEGGETKDCRFCGEPILVKARKCRHCGEYQDDKDRKSKADTGSSDEDDKLTAGEWVLGIICSGIACIVAIVWICQGKKKGWKLLLVAIVAQIIIGIIQALANL